MNRINLTKMYVMLSILGFVLITLPHFTSAQTISVSDKMSTAQPTFLVQGKISSISLKTMSMTIKPNKDKRVRIQLAEKTEFVGFYAYVELEKGQRLNVWYKTDGETKTAVKIEKRPELGC